MKCRYLLTAVVLAELTSFAAAQGTKLWTLERYADLARGTSEGVAIRSDGRLLAGPATSLLYATGGSYVWSLAADAGGNAYAGMGGSTGGSAAVMKVAANGVAAKIFESKELGVQALRVLPGGDLAVATSPDGKVYRIPAAGGAPVVLFDPAATDEKSKYIWDVVESGGDLFVATGAPAAVYRVGLRTGGKVDLLFRTADQHIRCLLAAPGGVLWAGSDGSGVIYRISTMLRDTKPFAVYSAPKREITALAIDAAGTLYAAGVGARGAPSLPPLPVTGSVGVSITFAPPQSATATSINAIVPEGSEIYRIGKDGASSRLLTLREDVVYALAIRNGALLAATGNRGRVYQVDTAVPGRFTDVVHVEAAQGMTFAAGGDGLLLGTSNTGKVFKLRDRVTSPAIYTSPVFDAQGFSQWGRTEVRSSAPAAIDLYVRTGNVESPLMGWSDWTKVAPSEQPVVPAGRFAQWKTVLREGGSVDAVGMNYLQSNVAPVVDEVVVQPGARVAAGSGSQPNTTVQVSFPAPPAMAPSVAFASDPSTSPLTAQKDKTAITIRWSAHDENGDDLMFAVLYKGAEEANWHLLKDKITDRFLSFDSALLPDGSYTVKVMASDAPVHTDAEALKNELVSEVFVIDTTPPVPGLLTAAVEGRSVHARLEAHDATSPISHAEYSVDAGPWQYLEPVGKLSDGLTEHYDFLAPLPPSTPDATDAREHLIAVRVYDRYENVAAVKAVVR